MILAGTYIYISYVEFVHPMYSFILLRLWISSFFFYKICPNYKFKMAFIFMLYIYIPTFLSPSQISMHPLARNIHRCQFPRRSFLRWSFGLRVEEETLIRRPDPVSPAEWGWGRRWSGPKYGGFCRLSLLTQKILDPQTRVPRPRLVGPGAETPQFQRLKLTPQSFGILAKSLFG